jgi:hypothetical protein
MLEQVCKEFVAVLVRKIIPHKWTYLARINFQTLFHTYTTVLDKHGK